MGLQEKLIKVERELTEYLAEHRRLVNRVMLRDARGEAQDPEDLKRLGLGEEES